MRTKFIAVSSLLFFGSALASAYGQTFWKIYSPGTQGPPFGSVAFSDSTLYGTAGDTFALRRIAGSVFRVNSDGSGYTVLKNFTLTEGQPRGGLTLSGVTLYGVSGYGDSSNYGSVFRLNIDGTGFTTIKNFAGGSDGAYPGTPPTLSGTLLFGTTSSGGSSNRGTIFRLNVDGSGFAVLKSFTGGSEGADPGSHLVVAGSTLYGTTTSGGSLNRGTLFRLGTDGSGFAVLYNFTNSPQNGLELSGTTLFGITYVTVFRINTDGTGFTVLKTFTGPDGNQASGLLLSGTTLYGTTSFGGSADQGTIFQLNTDGTGFTTIKNFDGTNGSYPAGLTICGNALYGNASVIYGLALPTDPPKISVQPRSQAVQAGSTASFIVRASGAEPLSYQWYFNGSTAIPAATDSNLELTSVQPSQAGNYSVEISNVFKDVISWPAKLEVIPPGTVPVVSCTEAGLRAALKGGSPVTFNCDGTITLASTLVITNDTVVDGSGHQIAISGGGLVRVFYVTSSATLMLKNLTILSGLSTNGAGIYNDGGMVNATNCDFVGNIAVGFQGQTNAAPGEDASGGAILNRGLLNAEDRVFKQNSAYAGDAYYFTSFVAPPPAGFGGVGSGGAICNFGTLNIYRSTLSSNTVSGGNGGISGARWLQGPPAGAANGGALYNGGSASLDSCAVIWNTAVGGVGGTGARPPDFSYPGGMGGPGGDGIAAVSGSITAVNSTFAHNSGSGGTGGQGGPGYSLSVHMSSSGGPGGGGGTGWAAIKGSAQLTNCTIAFNSGSAGIGGAGGPPGSYLYQYGLNGPNGGALGAVGGYGSSVLLNTLLATNLTGNAAGPLTDLGHNLSSDNSCNFTGPGSLNNTDPMLGLLADNGGPTLSMALIPGSPAIDTADPSSYPATDQRRFPRPNGRAPDIGAFEYGSTLPALTITRTGPSDLDILVRGNPNQSCRLFTSPNFLVWTPIATNNIGLDGTVSFHLNCNPAEACRFYRVSMP